MQNPVLQYFGKVCGDGGVRRASLVGSVGDILGFLCAILAPSLAFLPPSCQDPKNDPEMTLKKIPWRQ